MHTNRNAADHYSAASTKNRATFTDGMNHTTIFSPFDLDLLLSRVKLEELAQTAGTKLHRSGKELRGACPLHHGDNPTAFSIHVKDGREYWRCFTRCNTGGDAIEFIQKWQGLDFIGAVKYLAEYAGLSPEDIGMQESAFPIDPQWKQRTDLFDEAAKYFAGQLWEEQGADARAYLTQRSFTEQTLREAGWGYSISDDRLIQHLQREGRDISLARETGLIRADGSDFTANANGRSASPDGYIIYPHLWNGHTVYFSARALRPVDLDDKSRNLPGSRQVYWALVPGDQDLIIVEGQTDAESLRQIGCSALALCGVGDLPQAELEHVRRKRTVYLALDNDLQKTGLSDAEQDRIRSRTSDTVKRLCERLGPLTMVVQDLPWKDVNEWLQQGLTHRKLEKVLSTAKPWLDLLIERSRSIPPTQLDEHIQAMAAHLGQLPATLQTQYISQIERKLKLGKREIRKWMNRRPERDIAIYSEIKENRLHFMGEPLGNFWARISHELTVEDGLNPPTVRYSIEGGLADGQPLQPIQVEARMFGKLDWVPDNWGMRPVFHLPPGKAYLAARAIQEISMDTVQRERLFTCTGWREAGEQRGFLSSSGWLTADGLDEQVRVDLGSNNLQHYFLPNESFENEAAVRASLEFLSLGPRRVTAPLWAAMYAAPLSSLRSLNAVISVYGTTQSGKSTIAHLALAHFGTGFIQGRDYHAPIDWTSTVTAIEAAMFLAKDVPLIIDDFAPQFSSLAEARAMHKKAHYVVRSVGNRSARGRSRSDLSQQVTRFPRGLVIMTAENPLIGQSIVGRMLYVGVEPGDVLPASGSATADNDPLTNLQEKAQQGALTQAMSLYLRHLAGNWGQVASTFPAMVDRAANTARQAGSLQNRLPDAYAVLSASQELALGCFCELGFISDQETKRLMQKNNAALLEIIQSQAEQVAAESPVRKFFIALTSLLEQKKIYLAPRTQAVEFFPPANADLVGYFEPGEKQSVIYLRTEACLAKAKEFWRGLDENLDMMPDALRRQLSQIPGLLSMTENRQVEVSKYCGGSNQRVLIVDIHRVQELYGVSFTKSEK